MKKTLLFTLITTLISHTLIAQIVPTNAKKTIEVKESHLGEYLQEVKDVLPEATIENFKTLVKKKMIKYGFDNIKITEVG